MESLQKASQAHPPLPPIASLTSFDAKRERKARRIASVLNLNSQKNEVLRHCLEGHAGSYGLSPFGSRTTCSHSDSRDRPRYTQVLSTPSYDHAFVISLPASDFFPNRVELEEAIEPVKLDVLDPIDNPYAGSGHVSIPTNQISLVNTRDDM